MPVPANDTRATAELLPVGSYWGVLLGGTTVDATEDAGGPVDGFGAQDVFYYWADLPAGTIYVHVEPKPGFETVYFEAALAAGLPTDWTAADTWLGSGYWGPAVGDDLFPCVFSGVHPGGPASLCVFSFTGDPSGDAVEFDLGWGHSNDPTSSHWGTVQDHDWEARIADGVGAPAARRGIFQTGEPEVLGHVSYSPITATVECSYGNAAHGVVRDIASGFGCPGYIGPGPGTSASAFTDWVADVGQYHVGNVTNLFTPLRTSRTDRVGVQQQAFGINLGETYTSELDPEIEPDAFLDYAVANGRENDHLVWGWEWQSLIYDLRNLSFAVTCTLASSSPDVLDDCDVTLRAVVQANVETSPIDFNTPNQISLSDVGATITATYFEPETLGAEIHAIADGTATYTIVDPEPWLVATATDPTAKYLAAVFVAQQTIDGVYPTWQEEGSAAGNRNLTDIGGGTFDSKTPDWLPYLGFPLVLPSGWRVGRVAAGNTPW